MIPVAGPATLDTNVALYAFGDDQLKIEIAKSVLDRADFISVQLLNEFANVASRKQGRAWLEVETALSRIHALVSVVLPIALESHRQALRLASRYQLSFYDSLMLAVALSGGARTIYSEDMHHGLVIDDTLRIVDPFR